MSANAGPNLSGALWGRVSALFCSAECLRRWGLGWDHVTPVTDVAGGVAVAKDMSPESAAGFARAGERSPRRYQP